MRVLGIFVVVSVIGMVILTLYGKTIPDGLIVIGSVALGLFAGYWRPRAGTNNTPRPGTGDTGSPGQQDRISFFFSVTGAHRERSSR